MRKQLIIKVFWNKNDDVSELKKIFQEIKDYFDFSIEYLSSYDENSANLKEKIKNVDFCFIFQSKKYQDMFSWNLYSTIHENNKEFKLVFLNNSYCENDYILFKNGADDIIYLDKNFQNLKWKFLSLLRRRWDDSHTKHVLIRNGVVIDLLKHKVILNNKEINITKKEFELLAILVEEFNKDSPAISKHKLYKLIYKDNKNDNSRIIDQLFFRLKQKIGKDFFFSEKNTIKII